MENGNKRGGIPFLHPVRSRRNTGRKLGGKGGKPEVPSRREEGAV